MQGRRVYITQEPTEKDPYPLPDDCHPGDYWFSPQTGVWMVYCPKGGVGSVANHTIVEHEDKTITVSPSILLTYGPNGENWHGYLERGIWREV